MDYGSQVRELQRKYIPYVFEVPEKKSFKITYDL